RPALRWEIRRLSYEGSSAIELKVSGKELYLDSTGIPPKKGKDIHPVLYPCRNNGNQMWTVTRVDDQWDQSKHWLKLESPTVAQCIDSAPPKNREPHFVDCSAREQLSQQWTIELPASLTASPVPIGSTTAAPKP